MHRPFLSSGKYLGVRDYFAAHGLAAHGFAAHGLAAAQGLAAHGLHGLQGLTTFFAAHGLAAHGFAAHGFAAHGLAAQGFAVQVATSAVGVGSGAAIAIGAAIARLAPTASAGIRAVWAKRFVFLVIIASLKMLSLNVGRSVIELTSSSHADYGSNHLGGGVT
ncbi:hypothetical protein [Thalassospira lucentensis]|uniref:hypothetical protein n=1 Tax=Thalassospira lucentensis TaxID=168935 RepID=UPI00399D668F